MPQIMLIDQISLGGFRDRANEDRAGMSGSHAWVIDGATGLGAPFVSTISDAAWLAQRTHEAFVANASHAEPTAIMSNVAHDLVRGFEAERTREVAAAWELPCGAFILATATGTGVTITWNGDCRAVVRADSGPVFAFGATAISEEAEAALVARVGAAGDPAERYKQPEALEGLRTSRSAALAAGEAQILSPDLGFLKHLNHASVNGSIIEVLLMSDGFAAAELRYGLVDGPVALLDALRRDGLAATGLALRRFEQESDPDCRLKPRWKRSDDATAIWLKIIV